MPSVLITGASSGIGAATALRLDAAGYDVFAGLHEAGDDVSALRGASARLRRVVLDVTSTSSMAAAVEEVSAAVGPAGLDAVVNNAGIGLAGPVELLPLDDLRRQLEVNVVGQVAVTQAVLPLIRRAHGRIVLVSSIGGRVASAFAAPYYASKHALEAVGEALRQELDDEGIPVVLIEPAVVSTPIWSKGIAYLDGILAGDDPRLTVYRDRLASFRDSLRSADENGMEPDRVAQAIAEVLADESPDPRVVVGGAGKVLTALRPFVPDRIADKLAERTTAQP